MTDLPSSKQKCTCTEICARKGRPFAAAWSWECQKLPYMQPWRPAHETSPNEADILQFIGWLSGDLPELHHVEMHRLKSSWERFKGTQRAIGLAPETTAPPVQRVLNAAGTESYEVPQFIETDEDGSPLKAKGHPDLVEVMVGGAKLTVAVEPKSTAIPDCEPGCDCDFCHAPPVKASEPLCEQHGQIVETGCRACEAALGRITSDPWVCHKCQQLNSAGATTCGRCEDL